MADNTDVQPDIPLKAYKNLDFLNSPDARTIRILAEFLEPELRFRKHRIHDTIVFFGSSRFQDETTAKAALDELTRRKGRKKRGRGDSMAIRRAKQAVAMSRYYEDAVELSRVLTKWSLSLGRGKRRFIVCSGGGPGIMEAANRGATSNKKGYSIGLNISIPFEQSFNPHITPELNFEFHYFFIRKYWFIYMAKALVVFPGGFGTMDELFEVLTLIQTEKVKKKMPVVLYGKDFWKKVINFDALVEFGTISKSDLDLFYMADTPDEACNYLKENLTRFYLEDEKKK